MMGPAKRRCGPRRSFRFPRPSARSLYFPDAGRLARLRMRGPPASRAIPARFRGHRLLSVRSSRATGRGRRRPTLRSTSATQIALDKLDEPWKIRATAEAAHVVWGALVRFGGSIRNAFHLCSASCRVDSNSTASRAFPTSALRKPRMAERTSSRQVVGRAAGLKER